MVIALMAKAKGKTVELEISEIDQFVIDKARELRVKKGMSQLDLSIAMGLAEGTIAKIENPRQPNKYNIRHINLLARSLNCSPKDLFPEYALPHDLIRLRLLVIKNPVDAKGKPNYEIVKREVVKGRRKE
jgi:transcriptional regulator with XRE-family HTH domain